MHFEKVFHSTDRENLYFLAPIPLFVKKFEDSDFDDELFSWGMENLDEAQKRMGQELPGRVDLERSKLFTEYLKPDSWVENEEVPIGSRFFVSPNNFLDIDDWKIQELRNRILQSFEDYVTSMNLSPRNVTIPESWIQYYDPHSGRGHNQHNHTRWQSSEQKEISVSGGYYLSDGDPSKDHPYSGAFCFHVRGMSHFIRPQKGLLMMWPSDILHSVKPFYGKKHRCVINFNILAET